MEKRCAIYTRKSHEEGLDQEYNSLDAQRDACEAYIKSQAHEGWKLVYKHYDDGGFSGGTLKRPALETLMQDIQDDTVDVIVVYKIDRLTRSLMDFSKIMDVLDASEASFAAVTQHFNTTTSMGRLTLNVLLSFAQFEREVTGERIRDKIAASKKKGMWTGGPPMLGYDIVDKKLIVNQKEAKQVCTIFEEYLKPGNVTDLVVELDNKRIRSKRWVSKSGKKRGGARLISGTLYKILQNPVYNGKVRHKVSAVEGRHEAIVSNDIWEAVQAQLATNRKSKADVKSSDQPRVLKNKIFDSAGNLMRPTYAVKNGNRRYPYYVSAPMVGNRKLNSVQVSRVPAESVEELILDRLRTIEQTSELPVETIQEAVERVTIYTDLIELRFKLSVPNLDVLRLNRADNEVSIDGGSALIRIRATLRKWSRQLTLISDAGKPTVEHNEPDEILVRNLTRAIRWCEELENGDNASIQEIARRGGVEKRYELILT